MTQRKKLIFLSLLVFVIVLYSLFSKKYTGINFAGAAIQRELSSQELEAFHFLLDKMQNENGLFYSWVEPEKKSDDVLLEAMGQSMEYFALLGDKRLLEHYMEITNHYFISARGYYFWNIDIESKSSKYYVTAFVDDLRLAKAYFIFRSNYPESYNRQLRILSNKIYKFNVDKNKYPCDFYDSKMKQKSNELSLFYIDVETLQNLSIFDKKWSLPYTNALSVLTLAPENENGFYPKNFKINEQDYCWEDPVNMVENLYTAINAFHAGKDTSKFVDFLKEQINKGIIYNKYNLTGSGATEDESASIYALAARFLHLNKEEEAARWCYEKTLLFQITEKSPFSGGFGDEESGSVYSFNHLETLLMFRHLDIQNKN